MQAIGIDIGSSTVKGAVLDLEQGTIGRVTQIPFPEPLPTDGPLRFEVDPDAVVQQVDQLARQLLESSPDCSAVFFSSQMGGLVLVGADGRARTNYISWRDQRVLAEDGECYFDRLRNRLGETIVHRLGNEFRPGNAISLLAWLADHAALPDAPVTAPGIGEYVIQRLCGCKPAVHLTHSVGMLDLTTRDWCLEAIERLGLQSVRWPAIVDLRNPVGEWKVNGRRLKCFAAVGDHPCALAGAGLEEGELSINISTGSQVSARTPAVRLGSKYQTRPYFNGGWINTITHLPAGRSLNALVDLLTELTPESSRASVDVWERIGRAVQAVPATDLKANLAFFSGPAGDRGSINNISLENLTVGNLFRAAINNMADNYFNAAQLLANTSVFNRILFSGGLAQKLPTLAETIADRLQLPFRIAATTEETLQGLMEIARAWSRT